MICFSEIVILGKVPKHGKLSLTYLIAEFLENLVLTKTAKHSYVFM